MRQALPLRRLLAVLALLAGGLGAEAVQPGPCQLICSTRERRARGEGDAGGPHG